MNKIKKSTFTIYKTASVGATYIKKIYKTEQCATGQVYVREVDFVDCPVGDFEFTTCPGTIDSVGKYSLVNKEFLLETF
jgi:hypothetical protein